MKERITVLLSFLVAGAAFDAAGTLTFQCVTQPSSLGDYEDKVVCDAKWSEAYRDLFNHAG